MPKLSAQAFFAFSGNPEHAIHTRRFDSNYSQLQKQFQLLTVVITCLTLLLYLSRAGYYQTALKLAKHSDIQDYTNIDLFVAAKEVEESLAKHETLKCLTW